MNLIISHICFVGFYIRSSIQRYILWLPINYYPAFLGTYSLSIIGNVNCQQTALQECIAPTVAMQIFLDVLASLRPILESD